MKAIAVVDKNWGIGKDGQLLIRLPGDLRYFRSKTLGKVVVIGRETLESFPGKKPLPDRTVICLTRNQDFIADCIRLFSIEECLKYLEKYPAEDIYIAGGESIYRQFLPYCDQCLITKIDEVFPADRFFINLDESGEFKVVKEGDRQFENGVSYRFLEYARRL
ncbi:dihydrofolate reductase [Clostridia bacterium]|nr:dihydrofolate reductase [Clostridia bacterium]